MKYHIIAVTNPHSSSAARVSKSIKQLEKKMGSKVTRVQSEKDPAVFIKKFAKTLKENSKHPTVVLIGGGDGTVHQVVEATIEANYDNRSNIILMPIWGGNANDFAYMLNGLGLRKDLYKLINRAKVVKIHPLEIERSKGKTSTKDYAICYASFGASAFAADILDKSGPARKGIFRNISALVIIGEMSRVFSAFLHAPPFNAQVNGERVEIFEQVFTNGSRIAKVDRLPVNLTDKAFYKVAQPSKHPYMVIRVLKLLTGRQVGEVTDQAVTFEVKESVLGQFDGEVVKIPEDTNVTIRMSDKNIFALSTRLENS